MQEDRYAFCVTKFFYIKMKTKNLFYLFATAFLFVNVFFVGVDGVKNVAKADCYDECSDAPDPDYCFETCMSMENTDTGGVEYSCGDSYPGSVDAGNGSCTCPGGYDWNASGTACVTLSGNTATTSGVTQAACSAQGNYVVSDDGQDCIPVSASQYAYDQEKCDSIYGLGYVPNSNNTGCDPATPASSIVRSVVGCTDDSECNKLNKDSACGVGLDGKQVCMDQYENPISAPVAQVNSSTTITTKDGVKTTIPAGSIINADGSVTQNGSQVLPPGSVDVPSSAGSSVSGGNLSLCPNGILGSICSAGVGSLLSGVNLSSGSSVVPYSGNTGSGVVGGVGGSVACGAGFAPMGGVCFPVNTGLSAAKISDILVNIFSWLMGLFTVFAVAAFVISGIQYLAVAGNEEMAETAKHNATNAVIGIIIGLSGFIIIKAIATALSGTSSIF